MVEERDCDVILSNINFIYYVFYIGRERERKREARLSDRVYVREIFTARRALKKLFKRAIPKENTR